MPARVERQLDRLAGERGRRRQILSATEMALLYASLAAPAVLTAHEEAMSRARDRLTLVIAPVGQPTIPGRGEWLRSEMLKTRAALGYCSR